VKTPGKTPNHTQGELHPRNLHRAPYDFAGLVAASPALREFVRPHPVAGETVDWADPAAVLALNRALLKLHYGIDHWEIPPGYLCPPVPSRADALHALADLLADGGEIPRGPAVRVLDIGVGANCIYALVGTSLYGWTFVGTDIDPKAVAAARRNVAANPGLTGKIEIRHQPSPTAIFDGVVSPGETFALSLCNPPFHASAAAAAAGTSRKLRNLGQGRESPATGLNFGGRSHELWCDGGEIAFVQRMIRESAARPALCRWFTTLVSKQASLPAIERALARVKPATVRILPLFAGQKQSRILAWRF
jgi:23S rRNA (adenine1618-N6)-methyltransferase